MGELADVKAILKEHKQEHLLQHYDNLNAEEQSYLLSSIKKIDFKHLRDIQRSPVRRSISNNAQIDEAMEPIPHESFGSGLRGHVTEKKNWESEGLRLISESKVAVLVLAGGQGTRLGSKNPKGMYNVGIPSGKTLYQVNAEKILRLQEYAYEKEGKRGIITWYIMTSEATMESTKTFFVSHNYFGLSSENVKFFEQFTLPCTDFEGKVLLAQKHKIACSPDGNGGLYRAMKDRQIIDDMSSRGIECIHVHCVDNILQKTADPVFIGFCRLMKADCGAKVVEKTDAHEAVGVVCKVDGVYQVVEYSEISSDTAEKTDKEGRLLYNAGNICNHYFTMEFLKRVCSSKNQLPHHIARKKIPHVNEQGDLVTPTEPNGIKMEKFVFDVFQLSKLFYLPPSNFGSSYGFTIFLRNWQFVVFEVSREDEFSPLKNPEGSNSSSPLQARWSLASLHHRQILDAGGFVVDEKGDNISPLENVEKHTGEYPVKIEISPLLSYDGENLEKLVKGKKLQAPVTLDLNSPISNGSV